MYCPHCRTALPTGSKFCLSCGKPMPAAGTAAAAPPSPSAPPRAPAAAPPYNRGPERTVMHRPPVAPPEPPEDARSRVLPLIAAALLALLLVGGGGFWLLRRSQAPAGSVAAVPVPGQSDGRSIGAPPFGPGVVANPGQGGPGHPNVSPGAGGPPVTGNPNTPTTGGPGVAGAPAGPGGPAGPGVTAAPPGARGGPPVTGAPQAPQGGPPVVQAPSNDGRPGPSVTATPPATSSGPPVTATPGGTSSGPPVTATPARPNTGPPVASSPSTPRPADTPPRMPDDIRRYLAFLQAVEFDRRAYESQLIATLLQLLPGFMMPNFDDDSVQSLDPQLVNMYSQTARRYYAATRTFEARARRVGVPASCVPLHRNYSYALNRHPFVIDAIGRRLATRDLGGLLQMRGTLGADVDQKFAAADRELRRICDHYNLPKSFELGNPQTNLPLFGF